MAGRADPVFDLAQIRYVAPMHRWYALNNPPIWQDDVTQIDNDDLRPSDVTGVRSRLVCAISGKATRHHLVPIETLHHSLEDRIRADHPAIKPDDLISQREIARYRAIYVEEMLKDEKGELSKLDREVTANIAAYDTLAQNTVEDFEEKRILANGCPIELQALAAVGLSFYCFAALLGCG